MSTWSIFFGVLGGNLAAKLAWLAIDSRRAKRAWKKVLDGEMQNW